MIDFSDNNEVQFMASMNPAYEYIFDRFQRNLILGDLLRKQGNIFFKDLEDQQPPVISFKYEIIMDGRDFDKPVNYALTRIIERRSDKDRRLKEEKKAGEKKKIRNQRRQLADRELAVSEKETKRPIVIIDPRSGNAPGIAGSKKNSEIGMALNTGHPVYYIIFFPDPEKDQTLEDVKNAEIKFIEEVRRLHPDSPRPSVMGNSQAGWALAMLGAEEPDLAGPMILNGSPISYWAGEEGKHIMRYRAGIVGGSWTVSLLSDMGNGLFDGAHLVSAYEAVDPANTFLRKPYKLFRNIDKEHSRYLKFERWWNSYYMMTEEEINFIVNKLFIENSLEKGEFEFQDGKNIDLKDLKDPIVLFSSGADNVAPPQQALNWITKVWGSEEEIKDQDQVIVYLLHENIRHMGIFISDKVAKKEHKGIIDSVDKVGFLSPGLYEMVMEKGDPRYSEKEYNIRFETRTFEDIKKLETPDADELNFYPVVAVSYWNEQLYINTLRPLMRAVFNKWVTPFVKMHNPQRLTRYVYSDMNPFMYFFKIAGKESSKNRVKVSKDNPFISLEEKMMDFWGETMDFQRELRDASQEYMFRQFYGNPFIKSFFSENGEEKKKRTFTAKGRDNKKKFKGGFPEAVLRMMVAVAGIDDIFHDEELVTIMDIAKSHSKLKHLTSRQIQDIISQQSKILNEDYRGGLESLSFLLDSREERLDAIELSKEVARSDLNVSQEEDSLIIDMMEILKVS